MKLYCVSLHFNHFFKSSDVLNFVKNIMGITAVLFALASLFSIVNNDGYFFKVFVKIGKVPYEGLMSLLTCHTQKKMNTIILVRLMTILCKTTLPRGYKRSCPNCGNTYILNLNTHLPMANICFIVV